MSARVVPLPSFGSFSVVCSCDNDPKVLLTVEGSTLWSWHLRHAWGGTAVHCDGCGKRWALAGHVAGATLSECPPLPDVVCVEDLPAHKVQRLPDLATCLLDTALLAEDVLWSEATMQVRRGEAGEEKVPGSRFVAAMQVRMGMQRKKLEQLRLIREALGLAEWPESARIARGADGAGYYVDLEAEPPVEDAVTLGAYTVALPTAQEVFRD